MTYHVVKSYLLPSQASQSVHFFLVSDDSDIDSDYSEYEMAEPSDGSDEYYSDGGSKQRMHSL